VSSWFDDHFQKARTVARCSAVNKLQISGADSTAVNKFSGAFNKFWGIQQMFGAFNKISGAFNSIQPLPSVCLLGGGDERERKSVVE
jgi:hypothetical protein